MHAGLPQGSVLGPLFFLIYINNLPYSLNSNVKTFADDTCFFRLLTIPNLLQTDIFNIHEWEDQWKMVFNPDTSKQAWR